MALKNGNLRRADELLSLRPQHADRGQRANQRLELYVQGERALAAGHDTEALRLFQRAVKQRTPLYAVDWYEDCLASALLRLGRHDEAIQEYHRVLTVYPRLALAWRGIGRAFLAKQQSGLARQAFAKVGEIWKRGDKDLPHRAEADRPIGPMHDRLPVSVKPAAGSKASILSNERVLVGNWELGSRELGIGSGEWRAPHE